MRKFLISLMTASMLVPAVAYAEDGVVQRAMRSHAERSSQRDNKSDDSSSRSQSSQRVERSDNDRPAKVERAPREVRGSGAERAQRVERAEGDDRGVQRVERAGRGNRDGQRLTRVRRGDGEAQQVEPVQTAEPVQSTQQTERRREGLAGAFSQIGRDMADGRSGDRDGNRDWRRDRDGRRDWSRDWRRDRRYDWSSYRRHYRSLFRLGHYYDPYGWGYRRFSIGFNLWPSYYGSSFWLDDAWKYRLPPAYGPYRWIRYYDDALLVNIYTGEVVDVVHNVFW